MFEMQQEIPQDLIRSFVRDSARILGDQLAGIYLHGSAAMGCYHPKKSDLDFMIVVKDGMTEEVKRAFMDRIVKLNANGGGLEGMCQKQNKDRKRDYEGQVVF